MFAFTYWMLCLSDLNPQVDLRIYAPITISLDQRPLFWGHKDTQPKEPIEWLQSNRIPKKNNLIYIATLGG